MFAKHVQTTAKAAQISTPAQHAQTDCLFRLVPALVLAPVDTSTPATIVKLASLIAACALTELPV